MRQVPQNSLATQSSPRFCKTEPWARTESAGERRILFLYFENFFYPVPSFLHFANDHYVFLYSIFYPNSIAIWCERFKEKRNQSVASGSFLCANTCVTQIAKNFFKNPSENAQLSSTSPNI